MPTNFQAQEAYMHVKRFDSLKDSVLPNAKVLYGYHRTLDAVTSSNNNGEEMLCFVYLIDYTDPSKPEVLRRSTLMLFDGTIDKVRCDAMEDLLWILEQDVAAMWDHVVVRGDGKMDRLSVPVAWLRSSMNTAAAQNLKKTSRTSTICRQPFPSVRDTSHKGFDLKRTAFAIQIDLTDNTMV